MLHEIALTGLRVFAYHGVFEHEKQYGQEFVIDATIWLDGTPAASGDNLAATLNYGTLAQALVEATKGTRFDLIEALAEHLLDTVLQLGGTQISEAKVTVHKPNAPMPFEFSDVSVTVKSAARA